MVTCYKKVQVMSEKSRQNFSSQFKTRVAMDAIRKVDGFVKSPDAALRCIFRRCGAP